MVPVSSLLVRKRWFAGAGDESALFKPARVFRFHRMEREGNGVKMQKEKRSGVH